MHAFYVTSDILVTTVMDPLLHTTISKLHTFAGKGYCVKIMVIVT